MYRGGRIYTVDAERSWAEAVAIANGRFVAVGSNAEIAPFVGPKTRVVELQGRMVLPGIHDMHAHPVDGGFQALVECSFPFTTPLDAILERIRACAAKTPKGEWIRGGQWAAETLETARPPTRARLDAAAPDHPVFLIDSTYHNAWVNSRALALLGIDAKTPDPSGGVILREKSGAPAGILFDNAAYGAMKRLPLRTPEQYQAAIRWAVAKMNALGVTAMKDALADGHAVTAYAALDRAGQLDMRVATSRPWHATWTESDADEARNLEHWRDDETPHVRTGFAKIFVDGIPPTRTAALLEPYPPDPKHARRLQGRAPALAGGSRRGAGAARHARPHGEDARDRRRGAARRPRRDRRRAQGERRLRPAPRDRARGAREPRRHRALRAARRDRRAVADPLVPLAARADDGAR